ncbi:hypothetical protein [Pseudoruegeria sp. HB172150]|uniref:hypothetical protein n=1 Tax=Pseudoruegeria sp. HB172150 TaxID=2721164 RepID=UPI00155797FC|nr:hypothetical protein [Pseudoruegeria sp. HB172150]
MDLDYIDRSGLIREAYRIEGITPAQCRSIFMEWALKLPEGTSPHEAITRLLQEYADPDHPMTQVLKEGLAPQPKPRRRGGWAARRT